MTKVRFKTNVTEHHIFPPKDNKTVSFEMLNKSMTIKMLDEKDGIITQTEIDRESAVQLAKYILFMTEQILPQ